MKTCPVCKARCFDDMDICYGCMHRFEEAPRESSDSILRDGGEVMMRDRVAHPARMTESSESHVASRTVHRELPRVFGAVDGDDVFDMTGPAVPGQMEASVPAFAVGGGGEAPQFELVAGPLAIASLGNGYRLVVAIERE